MQANRLLDVKVQPTIEGPQDRENENYYVSSLLVGNAWEHVDIPANPREGLRFFQTFEWASGTLDPRWICQADSGRQGISNPSAAMACLPAGSSGEGFNPLKKQNTFPFLSDFLQEDLTAFAGTPISGSAL